MLTPLPTSGAGADVAQNLLCRVRFTLEQWTQAAAECQQAVNLNQQNSDYYMWLGRVLGQEASHASLFSAYGDAKKSFAAMQTAVKLNPQNGPALSDLGDYYAQAPGIAGGGTDKAQASHRNSTRWIQPGRRNCAAISRSQKRTTPRPNNEYKQAAECKPAPAHQWTVLASFYRSRQRWTELDNAIQNCVAAAAKAKDTGVRPLRRRRRAD